MRRHYHLLSVLLLLVLVLVGCGGGDGEKLPPSASASAAELQVVDQREVEIEDGRILSLSPDGEWLLVEKGGEALCFYRAESLTEQSCALFGDRLRPTLQSVTWSPDSTRVALTDDALRRMFESDLWLLEAEGGRLTDLTDDGLSGGFLDAQAQGDELLLDLAPAWSPDGKALVFSRSISRGGERLGTFLYRISADGGEAEELLRVSDEFPVAVWHGVRWLGQEEIIYTVGVANPDFRDTGIWVAGLEGEDPQQVVTSDAELGPPLLLDVSSQGEEALILYYEALGMRGSDPNISYVALLDLETGAVEPLKQAPGEEPVFFGLGNAAFSPDGSKILYTYRDVEQQFHVVVRDLEGGVENVLFSAEEPLGVTRELGLGLNWADDDVLFVTGLFGRNGYLLSLGTE